MRFGVIVPQGWRADIAPRDFDATAAYARRAEELGFDSIWAYDHLQTRDGDPERLLECWTTLAALARETSRVQLGQIVTCAAYRNPLDGRCGERRPRGRRRRSRRGRARVALTEFAARRRQ